MPERYRRDADQNPYGKEPGPTECVRVRCAVGPELTDELRNVTVVCCGDATGEREGD